MMLKHLLCLGVAGVLIGQPLSAQTLILSGPDKFGEIQARWEETPLTEDQLARLPLAIEVADKFDLPDKFTEVMYSHLYPLVDRKLASANGISAAVLLSLDSVYVSEEENAEALAILDPSQAARSEIAHQVVHTAIKEAISSKQSNLRKAMGEAYAIRFTENELIDINAFISTEGGKSFVRYSSVFGLPERVEWVLRQMQYAVQDSLALIIDEAESVASELPERREYSDLSQSEIDRLVELSGLGPEEIESRMKLAEEFAEY